MKFYEYFVVWAATVSLARSVPAANSNQLDHYQLRANPGHDQICQTNVKQFSGYLDISADKHLFYWFFESQNKTAGLDTPLVVWLNGGPGCSSIVGMVTEHGPCLISSDGQALVPNRYAWNQNAHMLFIDQPVGTGFSYGTHVSNSTQAAHDLMVCLRMFYKTHSDYAGSPLALAGESYAAKYVPATALAIVEYNARLNPLNRAVERLPLRSVVIGNGWLNPLRALKAMPQMACNSSYAPILPPEVCEQMEADYRFCERKMTRCYTANSPRACADASDYCAIAIERQLEANSPQVNPYDVRMTQCKDPKHCYPAGIRAEQFLNQTAVQKQINARETNFVTCSSTVSMRFMRSFDFFRSYDAYLGRLLDAGVAAMVYAGDADWLCNHYGVKATLLGMEWSGRQQFAAAADEPWMVNGRRAGEARAAGNLTYVRVFGAGHMVPMDKPVEALEMLNTWLSESSFIPARTEIKN